MTVATRGLRNAFRNATRSVSIVLILGLAIGLAFVMLIARQAIAGKASTALSSVGNTVTIGPPGYSAGFRLGPYLTNADLAPITQLPGVTGVDENLKGSAKASNPPPKSATGGSISSIRPQNGPTKNKPNGYPPPIKDTTTNLEYPGTLTDATAGLDCEPKPCTPPIAYFTIYFSGSTDPTAPINIGATTLKIISGHAISGTSSAYNAMISQEMARQNGLTVGSTFTAYGKTLTVTAIFDSDNAQGNDTVITSLPALQRLGGTDKILTAIVTASSLTELSHVTSEIEHLLSKQASLVSYLADAERAVSDLNGVSNIALVSLVGAVGTAAVILFLMMVMIVRERKREIGILKAIGAQNRLIAAQFTTEAAILTLLGLVVGLGVGIVAAGPVLSTLVSHSGMSSDTGARGLFGAGNPNLVRLTQITPQIGWPVIIDSLSAALIIAAIASGVSAWMISRIRPAEVLRSS